MFKKELCSILTFYAASPIHAGSGASVATVDLPIQRERHTGWPHIQASEVKGALRSHFRNFCDETKIIIQLKLSTLFLVQMNRMAGIKLKRIFQVQFLCQMPSF